MKTLQRVYRQTPRYSARSHPRIPEAVTSDKRKMATCGEVCDNGKQTCTIEATVPTGFESVAAEEAKEMFQTECKSTRGRITFQTPAERVKDVSVRGTLFINRQPRASWVIKHVAKNVLIKE